MYCTVPRGRAVHDEPLFIYLFSNAYSDNILASTKKFRQSGASKVRDDFRRRGLCNHPLRKNPLPPPPQNPPSPVYFGYRMLNRTRCYGLPRELSSVSVKVKPSRRLLPRLCGREGPSGVSCSWELPPRPTGSYQTNDAPWTPASFLRNHLCGACVFFFAALLSRYSNVMLRPVRGVEETLRIVHQLVRAERLSSQRFASFARPHPQAPWMGHIRPLS